MEPPQQRRVGRYRIVGEIGRGGMGTVFEAEDESLNRRVALKTLPLSAPAEIARFEQEARFLAQLDHPNIVPVFDYGHDDQLVFLVSPFIRGETLAALVARGPMELPEARGIIEQLASALDDAHSQNVMHRDVKPENVLLSSGRPRLTDFGLAGGLEHPSGSAKLHQTGALQLTGSVRYMAPEAIHGEASDHRADIYSLGLVLLLVG